MATTLPTLAISPEGNLQRYLDSIRAFPMLTKNEDYRDPALAVAA